jgi:serine/threonine-protein kinase
MPPDGYPPAMPTGTLLMDRYELRGTLGRGGMAVVHDGWDHRLNRPVAIKMLHPGQYSQPDVRARFHAEAQAAAALNHPNIVAVHDCGEDGGGPFIVMERLPGATLADDIAAGPLPQARVRAMLDNVLAALSAAHAKGILHRDIKPGNILQSSTGASYKLGDFGIAKTGGSAYTLTGQIIGTIAYLSPERLSGAACSVADDLYAVGIVGFEAVSGRNMFGAGDNIGALTKSILYDTPPPLQALRPDADTHLVAVIERALRRDPRQRFRTAEDMRAALDGRMIEPPVRPATKVLEVPPGPATYVAAPRRPHAFRPRAFRAASKRTKRILTAAGLVAAVALTALAVALDSPTAPPTRPVSDTTSSAPTTPPAPPPPPPTTAAVQQNEVPPPPPAHGGKKGPHGNGKGPKKG